MKWKYLGFSSNSDKRFFKKEVNVRKLLLPNYENRLRLYYVNASYEFYHAFLF